MKSSNSFQAVYYNEQKIVEQKAALLAAVNFEGSLTATNFLSKSDYIQYFNEVSNLNSKTWGLAVEGASVLVVVAA